MAVTTKDGVILKIKQKYISLEETQILASKCCFRSISIKIGGHQSTTKIDRFELDHTFSSQGGDDAYK